MKLETVVIFVAAIVATLAQKALSNVESPQLRSVDPAVSVVVDAADSWTCEEGRYPPKNRSTAVGWGVVDLDAPPEQRWDEVVRPRAGHLRALITHIKKYVKSLTGSTRLIDLLEKDLAPLADTMRYPFGEEMKGIARATNVSLSDVVLFNIFYEVFTVCTSIVAEDERGRLYHARNLDFGLFMGWDVERHTWATPAFLRPLTVNLEFRRGGRPLFKSVNFAGYVGILTANRPKIFTLTMNERFDILDGGYIGIIEWLLGDRHAHWMGFLTRDVMENATSYVDAHRLLTETEMLAPAYFILAGNVTGQAEIITRSRSKAVDVLPLEDPKWFILQTNYDNWNPAPFYDRRRDAGMWCMVKISPRRLSFPRLFDVLSSQPVLNKLTVYTALMTVDDGHLESWIQNCKHPCDPF